MWRIDRLRRRTGVLTGLTSLALCTGCKHEPPKPADRPAALNFVDATGPAGIRFRHTHGGAGKKLMPETVGSGCAWLDYDGDGWQDLLFVNCKPLPGTPPQGKPTAALYRNRGDGTFEDRTTSSGLEAVLYGQGATVADYDNDGDPDVFLTCVGPNHLYRNNGNGTFTDVSQASGLGGGAPWRWNTGSVWLDYDRDGRLDLFIARYVKWTPQTDQFCGVPGGLKRYCPPWKYEGERCALYRNLGGGKFADVSTPTGVNRVMGKWFQPIVGDVNADGWPDVIVTSDGTPSALFQNEGGKRFTDTAAETGMGLSENGMPKGQMGVDMADWRNEGREGVLIGNFSGQRLSLFHPEEPEFYADLADRNGMGESSLYSLTFGVAFLDADLDGWRDAFIANGHIDDYIERFEANITYAQRPLLYHNVKGQRFEEVGPQAGPAMALKLVARGCAVADYDQDGDLDLAVTENNGPGRLYRNETTSGNRWLRLVLRGKKSNRDAVGARVEVNAGGVRQTQWVRAGGLFLSQNELPLVFGLGGAPTADVSITWPNGAKQAQRGVPAGQTLQLMEAP